MPAVTNSFESDFHLTTSGLQKEQTNADPPTELPANEKERENNVAKIKVVVCCLTLPLYFLLNYLTLLLVLCDGCITTATKNDFF